MAVWLSGNVVGHINEVTLRRAGLVLRWVTVLVYAVLVFYEATRSTSLVIPLWVCKMRACDSSSSSSYCCYSSS